MEKGYVQSSAAVKKWLGDSRARLRCPNECVYQTPQLNNHQLGHVDAIRTFTSNKDSHAVFNED